MKPGAGAPPTAFAAAFRKLTGQLNDRHALSLGNLEQALSFHPFAPDEADLETFQILSRALQEHRAVQFSYKNLGADKAQTRKVHPYHLACVENRWYLVAHDPARDGMRNFAMTRMRRLVLLPDRFTPPKSFRIEDYLKGSFGIFQAGDDFEVVVDFDKWAGELVRERKRTQVGVVLETGEPREVHHFALLVGYGASAVNPYLALDSDNNLYIGDYGNNAYLRSGRDPSRVTIIEYGEIANPFFRFMARLFMKPAIYLEIYLTALAEKFAELGGIALGQAAREHFGAPYYVIHRADLQTLLLDAERGHLGEGARLDAPQRSQHSDATIEEAMIEVSTIM